MVVTKLLKKVTELLNLLYILIITINIFKLIIEPVNLWKTTNSLVKLLPPYYLRELLPLLSHINYSSSLSLILEVISAYLGSPLITGVGLLYKVIPAPLLSISNLTSL